MTHVNNYFIDITPGLIVAMMFPTLTRISARKVQGCCVWNGWWGVCCRSTIHAVVDNWFITATLFIKASTPPLPKQPASGKLGDIFEVRVENSFPFNFIICHKVHFLIAALCNDFLCVKRLSALLLFIIELFLLLLLLLKMTSQHLTCCIKKEIVAGRERID